MGRFTFQVLLKITHEFFKRYNTTKNDRYSVSATDWTSVSLNFTLKSHGKDLNYNRIDSPHTNMFLSIIAITHSVY